jgi:hypothetical protein
VYGYLAPLDNAPPVVVQGAGSVDRAAVLGLVAGLHALGAEQYRLLYLPISPWLLIKLSMLSTFAYVTAGGVILTDESGTVFRRCNDTVFR